MSNLLTKRREPFQFMLYLGMLGSVLIFLMFTFIYLARKSAVHWGDFPLPVAFWVSTGVILLSSFALHGANAAFRRERFVAYRWLTGITLALGVAFTGLQYLGWEKMQHMDVLLRNNLAGAFLYVITGVHLLHIVAGLFLLAVTFINAVRRTTYVDAFVYSVNPPNQLRLKLVTVYWHFVDALWVYLFLFFLYHHH
jgi:cytochrome c oxidase subunit 3